MVSDTRDDERYAWLYSVYVRIFVVVVAGGVNAHRPNQQRDWILSLWGRDRRRLLGVVSKLVSIGQDRLSAPQDA